jgi:hypothetical protein
MNALNALGRKMKRPVGIFITTLVALIAGVAIAAWTATGSGNGYAKAKSAVALTTNAVVPAATLYPGASGQAEITIVNPNPYQVTVQSITGSGTITSDQVGCDSTNDVVAFVNQTGLSDIVPGNSVPTHFVLAVGSVTMGSATVDACQGATFTIPVTMAGVSS